MTHSQFLRIKKLKGNGIVRVAAKHNHREILDESGMGKHSHINPILTKHNKVLRGADTSSGIASFAQQLMDDAGIKKLRKDAVRALEIIFSLPPTSQIDRDKYFLDAVNWVEEYFPVPLISAIMHNDEESPHCHVLLVPLVNGRMVGSDLVGNRTNLKAMQTDFHTKVAQRYGFRPSTPLRRPSRSIRMRAAKQILDEIKANPHLLSNPRINQLVLDALGENPEPLLQSLGLEAANSVSRMKTFVAIMTKPCRPDKPFAQHHYEPEVKPIGFSKNRCHSPMPPYPV